MGHDARHKAGQDTLRPAGRVRARHVRPAGVRLAVAALLLTSAPGALAGFELSLRDGRVLSGADLRVSRRLFTLTGDDGLVITVPAGRVRLVKVSASGGSPDEETTRPANIVRSGKELAPASDGGVETGGDAGAGPAGVTEGAPDSGDGPAPASRLYSQKRMKPAPGQQPGFVTGRPADLSENWPEGLRPRGFRSGRQRDLGGLLAAGELPPGFVVTTPRDLGHPDSPAFAGGGSGSAGAARPQATGADYAALVATAARGVGDLARDLSAAGAAGGN